MSSGYNCKLIVNVRYRPEDYKRVEECVYEAIRHVFKKHDVRGCTVNTFDDLLNYMTIRLVTENDRSIVVALHIKITDIHLDAETDIDAENHLQKGCDHIRQKLREVPVLLVGVNAYGDFAERDPDISGWAKWEAKK